METRESVEALEQDAESTPDLGARLRVAREAQGLSIEEIAAELRLGAHFLNALEECRFEALGPPVFAKGYLKQYGTRLGLDAKELVADYESFAGHLSVEVAPSRAIKLRDERQITLWAVASGVLALVAVFLAFWWFRQSNEAPGAPEAPESAALRSAPAESSAPRDPAQPPASTPAAVPAGRVPVTRPPAPGADEAAPPVAEPPAAELPASDSPAAESLTAELPAADSPTPDSPTAQPPKAEPPTAEPPAAEPPAAGSLAAQAPDASFDGPALEVYFAEDSWAEVTDENGTRLYYALGRAGTRRRFPADRHLKLLFGNAHGVELRLDGREIPIPGSPQPGEVAQFELDALID